MELEKNTEIFKFKYNENNFIFIGETHSGLKKAIKFKGKAILEANKNLNNYDIKTIRKHYKNKKNKDESYIDLYIYSKIKYTFKKKLKDLNIHAIDTRDPKDYPKSQIRTIYKKNPKHIKKLLMDANKIKKLINNIKEPIIKKKLLIRIDNYINELKNEKSNKLIQTKGEIILDYEIAINVLNNKDKNVIGIFGKNHLKTFKKIFKEII